jgi:Tfp pilus assembly ATPase PilU
MIMASGVERLNHWLEILVAREGSDLFLVVGVPPAIRVQGNIVRLQEEPLEASVIEGAVLAALSPAAAKNYRDLGSDTSIRWEGGRRFRLNFHRERGRPPACIRALRDELDALLRRRTSENHDTV